MKKNNKNNKKESNKNIVFSTKFVEDVNIRLDNGNKVPRAENPYFEGKMYLKKGKIPFAYTKEELDEYVKCKTDIHYFCNNYVKIKKEDGRVGPMKLRDYQTDIMTMLNSNQYNLLVCSRQSGKCVSYDTVINIRVDDVAIDIPFYEFLLRYVELTPIVRIRCYVYQAKDFVNKLLSKFGL